MDEKQRQEQFPWQRSQYYANYNAVLGYYKYVNTLDHIAGDSLLDLACGDGLVTSKFADRFKRIVGVDASGHHIQEARKRLPNAVFHESLIEDFSPDETFDTVLMSDILEHVVDPISFLQKGASFLSKKGKMIIHVPNAEAVNRQIAVKMGTLVSLEELSPFDLNIAGHRRSYTLDSLTTDVEKAGLKVEKSGGIFYKMLSTAQMDWFLQNGLWEEGGFGWGRVGEEKAKNWRDEFCRACYELGLERPRDCNEIYAVVTK